MVDIVSKPRLEPQVERFDPIVRSLIEYGFL